MTAAPQRIVCFTFLFLLRKYIEYLGCRVLKYSRIGGNLLLRPVVPVTWCLSAAFKRIRKKKKVRK